MSGRWTHNSCEPCWKKACGDRPPVKVTHPEEEKCCYCGKKNRDGIFVREDPNSSEVSCKGEHPWND